MRDAGEVIEMLDTHEIVDMEFVMYSFHNDSSGKEHLAMEFARAKGYSDHLQDNVLRGLIEQEMKGKGVKPLSPAFEVMRMEDKTHHDHLKIVPSALHSFWRDAYRWKLEGKANEEIARLLLAAGYEHRKKEKGKWYNVSIDKDYIGTHLKNPIHCGWLVPKQSKEPRRSDLTKVYPLQYGEDFPIVVTVEEFKRVNPEMFKETAMRPKTWGRHSLYPLPSNKVLCCLRHGQNLLATMTPNKPRGGSGKHSPHFSCQRCKPQHSIGMEDVYKAVAVKLKDVKLTEREHKILVVTEWHEFKKDREAFDEALRHIAALKGTNKTEIGKCEERLNVMKYADKKAPQKDIAIEERRLERLEEERVSLLEREKKVGDDGMQRFNDLDAFLELAKNGSRYWTKALDDKKRILADMIVSNVMVDGDKVASVRLTPQFEEWAKRGKNLDGRGGGT